MDRSHLTPSFGGRVVAVGPLVRTTDESLVSADKAESMVPIPADSIGESSCTPNTQNQTIPA